MMRNLSPSFVCWLLDKRGQFQPFEVNVNEILHALPQNPAGGSLKKKFSKAYRNGGLQAVENLFKKPVSAQTIADILGYTLIPKTGERIPVVPTMLRKWGQKRSGHSIGGQSRPSPAAEQIAQEVIQPSKAPRVQGQGNPRWHPQAPLVGEDPRTWSPTEPTSLGKGASYYQSQLLMNRDVKRPYTYAQAVQEHAREQQEQNPYYRIYGDPGLNPEHYPQEGGSLQGGGYTGPYLRSVVNHPDYDQEKLRRWGPAARQSGWGSM